MNRVNVVSLILVMVVTLRGMLLDQAFDLGFDVLWECRPDFYQFGQI